MNFCNYILNFISWKNRMCLASLEKLYWIIWRLVFHSFVRTKDHSQLEWTIPFKLPNCSTFKMKIELNSEFKEIAQLLVIKLDCSDSSSNSKFHSHFHECDSIARLGWQFSFLWKNEKSFFWNRLISYQALKSIMAISHFQCNVATSIQLSFLLFFFSFAKINSPIQITY